MSITFDANKSRATFEARGLTFDMVERFDWTGCIVGLGHQKTLTEIRYAAVGAIDGKTYVVVFTFEGDGIRVISLRRARAKEVKAWQAARTRSSSTTTIPN